MSRRLFICGMILLATAIHCDLGGWGATAAADEAPAVADHAEQMRTLESLARDYRIAVYSTFRTNRERFREHRAAWDNIYSAWQRAGSPPEQVPKLIEWLTTATRQVEQRGAPTPGPSSPAKARTAVSHSLRNGQSTVPIGRDKEPVAERSPPLRPEASGPVLRSARKPELSLVPDNLASRPVQLPKRHVLPNPEPRVPVSSLGPAALAEEPSLLGPRWAARDVEPKPATSARINIIELKARTEGYNLGIAAVRQRLAAETEWTARKLAQVLVELEDLISRREDLALYHPLVEGRGLKPLASSDGLLADLHALVVAAKKQLAGSRQLDDEDRNSERELLDAVEQQLEALQIGSE